MFTRSTKPTDSTTPPQPAPTLTPPSMPSYAAPTYAAPTATQAPAAAPAPAGVAAASFAVSSASAAPVPAFGGPKKSAPSIVTSDLKIKGDLESEGDIQLEGQVFGTVTAASLTISESGTVNGEIFVDSLRVYGKIIGTSRARVVDLAKSSHVVGDIFHQQLTIETGAYIDGHCKRVDVNEMKPAPKEAKEARSEIKVVETKTEVRPEPPARPEMPAARGTLRARGRTAETADKTDGNGDRIAAMLGRLENSN